MPQSDGVKHIHNAAVRLTVARHKLGEAHTRLTYYLERGIVPKT